MVDTEAQDESLCSLKCSIQFDTWKNCTGFMFNNDGSCSLLFFATYPKVLSNQTIGNDSVWIRYELINSDVLLIVGGYIELASTAVSTTEILSIDGTCTMTLKNLPEAKMMPIVKFLNNQVWSCLGVNTPSFTSNGHCYQYSFEINDWIFKGTFFNAHNQKTGQAYKNKMFVVDESKAEVFDPLTGVTGSWPSTSVPIGNGMCSVMRGNTLIAVGGDSNPQGAMMYDFKSGAWTTLKKSPISFGRPSCSLLPYPNDDQLLVTETYGTAILDLTRNIWRIVADPNFKRNSGNIVQFNNRIFLVGGASPVSGINVNVIEEYNVDDNSWNQLKTIFTNKRSRFASMVVPRFMFGCN